MVYSFISYYITWLQDLIYVSCKVNGYIILYFIIAVNTIIIKDRLLVNL